MAGGMSSDLQFDSYVIGRCESSFLWTFHLLVDFDLSMLRGQIMRRQCKVVSVLAQKCTEKLLFFISGLRSKQ